MSIEMTLEGFRYNLREAEKRLACAVEARMRSLENTPGLYQADQALVRLREAIRESEK